MTSMLSDLRAMTGGEVGGRAEWVRSWACVPSRWLVKGKNVLHLPPFLLLRVDTL